MPSVLWRRYGSAPLDTCSDITEVSRASRNTASTTRVRYNRPSSHVSSTCELDQVFIQFSKVTANFSLQDDMRMRFPYVLHDSSPTNYYYRYPKSASRPSTGTTTTSRGTRSSDRKSLKFDNTPSMLLPQTKVRMRTDMREFVHGLRDSSVVALDPRSSLILSGTGPQLNGANGGWWGSSTSMDKNGNQSEDQAWEDQLVVDGCSECLRLLNELRQKKGLFDWVINQWNQVSIYLPREIQSILCILWDTGTTKN